MANSKKCEKATDPVFSMDTSPVLQSILATGWMVPADRHLEIKGLGLIVYGIEIFVDQTPEHGM